MDWYPRLWSLNPSSLMFISSLFSLVLFDFWYCSPRGVVCFSVRIFCIPFVFIFAVWSFSLCVCVCTMDHSIHSFFFNTMVSQSGVGRHIVEGIIEGISFCDHHFLALIYASDLKMSSVVKMRIQKIFSQNLSGGNPFWLRQNTTRLLYCIVVIYIIIKDLYSNSVQRTVFHSVIHIFLVKGTILATPQIIFLLILKSNIMKRKSNL